MVSVSSESTRQKHSRSSLPDDVEERSKRLKHRHHHHSSRHRRHHHRSRKEKGETTTKSREELEVGKLDQIEVEDTKLENDGGGAVDKALLSAELDCDMEEGEILEDDGLVDNVNRDVEMVKKIIMSDTESGEIDRNGHEISNMGDNLENVNKCQKDNNVFVDGEKRKRAVAHSHSHDKDLKEGSRSNLSKSPECSRARSRSRSILGETSIVGVQGTIENPLYKDRNQRIESDDERMTAHNRNYSHSRRYDVRDKEKQHSSSRFAEKTERHYGRETLDRHREQSMDRNWDRDRTREREMEEREKDRDIGRKGTRDGGKDRDRDESGYNGSDRFSTRHRYDSIENDYRNRDIDSRHRRNSGDLHRDRSRRSNLGNGISKSNPEERDRKVLKREDDRQEEYQEKIVLQLAEQEEDDLEKIKEESRKRTQAILAKYKNKHAKQHNEKQPQALVEEQSRQSSEPVESSETSFSVEKSLLQNGFSAPEKPTGNAELGEGTPKSERSVDMFCDDLFGESPAGVRKTGKEDSAATEKSELRDNWDDAEGYYGHRFGEIVDGRYEIVAAHGKGVFSTVVRARDLKAKPGDPEEVAIKVIRNNETMYKAGMQELVILKKLVGTDPEDKRHCVRFISTFKYRNHLCLVFESLYMNLREVLKKFGRNIGLKLTAVRAYAKQLFIALKHLKNCGVLHCDIKPDNMLVNEAKNVLKLCDFGNAMFAGKNEITPYLVSRFYRAPEIILGLPYDHPMDMWSVGCCLFELYAGKVLFPGSTNNDMLRLQMELKGPFPKKMLRKGGFVDHHFDQDLNFLAMEEDPVTKKAMRRLLVNTKPKELGTLIVGSSGEDPKMLANFKDLMERIFVLDPDKRLSVSQALSHPFITGK